MHWLSRMELLFGADAMEKLQNCRVAVFGLGGVGGHLAEALARSGVGHLDLIDHDTVAETNLNRQAVALQSTLGMEKVAAMKARILDINPQCQVTLHPVFYTPETAHLFDFSQYDYIADAIDTVAGKIQLVEASVEANVPMISAMGAGNKLDPTAFRVADLSKTKGCPLARVMRVELRKRGINHLKVVYSEEAPRTPAATDEQSGKRQTPGSTAFVPPVVGLIMAGEIVKDLTGIR